MMTNLFSTFDPSTSTSTSLNWSSAMLGIWLMPMPFWLNPSRINIMWMKMNKMLHSEFKNILKNKMKGSTLMFTSLFCLIMMNNLTSLFPYIFSSTSHLIMNLSMALPIWLSMIIYSTMNNFTQMMAHLIPQGTPPLLMPFMVCIETISNIIRPGTLAIRLMANMIAGHLILTLMGDSSKNLEMMLLTLMMTVQMMFITLEMAVAIIQSYVFSVLSALYSSELS